MRDGARTLLVRQCAADEVARIEGTEPPNKLYARSAYARQVGGDSVYLVAWLDRESVGSGEVVFDAPPELRNLNVRPAFRGLGIGTRIIAAAEVVAQSRGALVIGVSDDNDEARKLYLRLGYVPTGEVESYTYSFVDDDGVTHQADETAENLIKTL